MMEYETYRAIYCGLCKELGREFGPLARLTLSYDFAFLALLDLALRPEKPCFAQERCVASPLRKHGCCQSAQGLGFSAHVAMILLHHKLVDNIRDSKGLHRLGARVLKGIYSPAYRRAAAAYPQVDAVWRQAMEDQNRLEDRSCALVDEACEPTAQALGQISEMLSEDPGQRRVLFRFGYLLGRWIYLMDALDDLQEDWESGGYNAFLLAHQELLQQASPNWTAIREQAKGSLYLTVGELAKTFELLEVKRYQTILSNVVYLGLRERSRQLVAGETGKELMEPGQRL